MCVYSGGRDGRRGSLSQEGITINMKALRSALCALLLALVLLPSVGFAELIQSRPQSSVSSYDESEPQNLKADHLYAQSAILIDADSGRVLFSKNADKRLYPASMTKLMTALLAVENLDLDQELTASKTVAAIGESALYCEEGEIITVKDALYGMLLNSSNSYAGLLAEGVAGSIEEFAVMMTNRAKELGCTDTNFANPHGLTDENHYTTASDMAKIVQAAMKEPDIAQVVGTAEYTLSPNNLHESGRTRSNSNKMLPDSGDQFAYAYMLGGKTGYTDAAKHTFAGYAMKDGMRLISVVMGTTSDGKWLDTTKLMDYGFAAYERLSLAELYAVSPKTTNVQGAASSDDGVLQLDLAQELDPTTAYMVVSQAEKEDITANFAQYCSVEISGNLVAPIQQGQEVGRLRFQYGEMEEVSFPLVAARTVATELVSVTPPPSNQSGTLTDSGLFVSTSSGESGLSPLVLLVILPAALFLGLVVWLLIEIGRLKKERRIRRQRAREEAIRRRYEETRRNTRGPYESTVRIQRSRSAEDPYRAAPQRRGGQLPPEGPTRRGPSRSMPMGTGRPHPGRR